VRASLSNWSWEMRRAAAMAALSGATGRAGLLPGSMGDGAGQRKGGGRPRDAERSDFHHGPEDDSAHWDYVVEASLGLASGRLVIDGYPPAFDFKSAPPVPVAPGAYRVRVYHT